ncbi:hypothetical protein E4U21_004639 [Claviceps maximensis]|nr:hypothetical protein E4U21_004639 [Claviceps maximensis]
MPSRPELQLSLSTTDQEQPSSCDVRRPRFHEDFDAPFSEALLSPVPLSPALTATTSCACSPLSEHSSDMSLHVRYAPRPTQSREDSWSSTCSGRHADSSRNSSRRSRSRSRSRDRSAAAGSGGGVNDRIKDWARRSFLSARRPDDDAQSSR